MEKKLHVKYFYKFILRKLQKENVELNKKLETLKSDEIKEKDEINKLKEDIRKLIEDKDNLVFEINNKNTFTDCLQNEIKKNQEILNSYNSLNKENKDKDQIISQLKLEFYEMQKNTSNKNLDFNNDR